jgi:queuine/archaeosine tRNA-ribosyltransferase
MLHGLIADRKLGRYYLSRNKQKDQLVLKRMSDNTPFYYNVAMMSEIKRAIESDKLYTYHFTVLRSVMEKIKEFFGHRDFTFILEGIKYRGETYDQTAFSKDDLTDFYSRVVNVLTHQGSMFTPALMNEDNKELATAIFNHLVEKYQFVLPNLNSSWSEKDIAQSQKTE